MEIPAAFVGTAPRMAVPATMAWTFAPVSG
jgi:hypothetical protein